MTDLGDFVCTPDPNGDYLGMWIAPKNRDPMMLRLSVGAAELLAAEINAALRARAKDGKAGR